MIKQGIEAWQLLTIPDPGGIIKRVGDFVLGIISPGTAGESDQEKQWD
jgi:hypothetical protein